MFDLLISGRKLVFESALTHAEVTGRLQREVAPPKWELMESKKQELFEGTFADGRFSMGRMVRGRNSFRTMIDGQLSPMAAGTRIDATLRLRPLVVVLSIAMALFWTMVAWLAVTEDLKTGKAAGRLYISAGASAVFCSFMIATVAEARRATRMLTELFEAQPSLAGASTAAQRS